MKRPGWPLLALALLLAWWNAHCAAARLSRQLEASRAAVVAMGRALEECASHLDPTSIAEAARR